MNRPFFVFIGITLLCLGAACHNSSSRDDTNMTVPEGDPPFPPLGKFWVIDHERLISDSVIEMSDQLCERLKTDNIAEVVVVVMKGVKQPEMWATHYGRWLGLGKTGPSTEGGNRGLVWLIRPDANLKLTISVGRGMPDFTSADYVPMMKRAAEYFNFGNYDKGILTLLKDTDSVLRRIYGGKK